MCFQPGFVFFIIGIGVGHDLPKSLGMIELDEVGEFVDNDVILHFLRGKKQSGGQVDIPFVRAAAPSGPDIFQSDFIQVLPEVAGIEFEYSPGDVGQLMIGYDSAQEGSGTVAESYSLFTAAQPEQYLHSA